MDPNAPIEDSTKEADIPPPTESDSWDDLMAPSGLNGRFWQEKNTIEKVAHIVDLGLRVKQSHGDESWSVADFDQEGIDGYKVAIISIPYTINYTQKYMDLMRDYHQCYLIQFNFIDSCGFTKDHNSVSIIMSEAFRKGCVNYTNKGIVYYKGDCYILDGDNLRFGHYSISTEHIDQMPCINVKFKFIRDDCVALNVKFEDVTMRTNGLEQDYKIENIMHSIEESARDIECYICGGDFSIMRQPAIPEEYFFDFKKVVIF